MHVYFLSFNAEKREPDFTVRLNLSYPHSNIGKPKQTENVLFTFFFSPTKASQSQSTKGNTSASVKLSGSL